MPTNPASLAKPRQSIKAQLAEKLKGLEESGQLPSGDVDAAPGSAPFAVAAAAPSIEAPSVSADAIPAAPPVAPVPSPAPATAGDATPPVALAPVATGQGDPPPAAGAPVAVEPPPKIQPPAAAALEPPVSPAPATVAEPAVAAVTIAPTAAEEEYEDVTFVEGPGVEWKARVPKGSANQVKGGWLRQADYTRKTQQLADSLKQYAPLLAPLIADGRMQSIAPMVEAATRHQGFADAVSRLYWNLTNGHPLGDGLGPTGGQSPAAPASPATAAATAAPDVPPVHLSAEKIEAIAGGDPLVAAVLQGIASEFVNPLSTQNAALARQNAALAGRLDEMHTGFEAFRAQEQQRAASAEATRAQQVAYQDENRQIAQNFSALFPEDYPADDLVTVAKRLNELESYARDSQYITPVAGRYGGMLQAKYALDKMRRHAPTVAPTTPAAQPVSASAPVHIPSTAAAVVNDMETRARAAAAQAASTVATQVGAGGAGAPPQEPAPKLTVPRVGTQVNGKTITLKDQLSWIKTHAKELMDQAGTART